ncbi:unnamed protein product [Calicophoron daubneyi]|uniref:Uncharacterized protein n=1 Tax=Calicophoron daubneyi TaxID=300641 RepID=A0AAV2TPM4_CALDB
MSTFTGLPCKSYLRILDKHRRNNYQLVFHLLIVQEMDEQTQQNILFEFKRLTVIFLAGLLHFVWSSIAKEECVLLPSDLLTCAQKHGVTHIADIGVGYGFGFGSVQDVEVMCRPEGHQLFIFQRRPLESATLSLGDENIRPEVYVKPAKLSYDSTALCA